MSRRVYIIGGGNFGSQLARRLSELGAEVLIAERDTKTVEELSGDGFHVMELDGEDESALQQSGVQNADVVVVAIGENIQGSIIATLALKELGVKKIVSRAMDDRHAKVLQKIGADIVIHPSRDMANRLAERLLARIMGERLPVIEDYQIAHITVGDALPETTLAELKLPQKYKISVLLVLRSDDSPQSEPDIMQVEPQLYIRHGDTLVLFGSREHINDFERKFARSTTSTT